MMVSNAFVYEVYDLLCAIQFSFVFITQLNRMTSNYTDMGGSCTHEEKVSNLKNIIIMIVW